MRTSGFPAMVFCRGCAVGDASIKDDLAVFQNGLTIYGHGGSGEHHVDVEDEIEHPFAELPVIALPYVAERGLGMLSGIVRGLIIRAGRSYEIVCAFIVAVCNQGSLDLGVAAGRAFRSVCIAIALRHSACAGKCDEQGYGQNSVSSHNFDKRCIR